MSEYRTTKETIKDICVAAEGLFNFIHEIKDRELCITLIEECIWSWRKDGYAECAWLISEANIKSPLDELLANKHSRTT